MNLPAANSDASAGLDQPPPPLAIEILLPDGSCIPATPDNLKIVLRQIRSDARKKRKAAAREKADELQRNLEDRAAAWRLLQELAEIDRDRQRTAATLRASRVKSVSEPRRTTDVRKRALVHSRRPVTSTMASSWVIDGLGMRGVHFAQSYLGRKSPEFYRGAARDRWEYDARDEAVLRDRHGEPINFSNLGEDVDEIGAAWQCIEDATTRKNGKVQIRIIVAFDADAGDAENIAALRKFCESVLAPLGLPYSALIHRPPVGGDERNVHAHILTSFRPVKRIAPYCWAFADEVRGELDGKNGVQMLRHLWAHSMSEAAEKTGRNMRYTGLGYGARGLNLEPGEHLGEAKSAMVARGIPVWAWERNRIRNARNALRRAIRDADRKIEALTAARDAARAHQRAEREGGAVQTLVMAPTPSAQGPSLERAPQAVSGPARLECSVAADKLRTSLVASRGQGAIPRLTPFAALALPSRHRRDRLAVAVAKDVPHSRAMVSQAKAQISRTAAPELTSVTITARQPPLMSRGPIREQEAPAHAPPQAAPLQPFVSSLTRHRGDTPELAPGWATSASPRRKPDLTGASPTVPPNPMITRMDELLHELARARSRRDETRRKEQGRARAVSAAVKPNDTQSPPAALQPHRPQAGSSKSGPRGQNALPKEDISDAVRAARWRRARFADARQAGAHESHPLATRVWLEANPATPYIADDGVSAADRVRLAQLTRIDAYVADLGEGTFDIDDRALQASGADTVWLARPAIQQKMAGIRAGQQQLMAQLAAEASRRPLDFLKHGTRFWPRDLAGDDLRRLDSWSADPGFQNDVFEIERTVRAAHERRDAEQRAAARAHPVKPVLKDPRTLAVPVPDRFGGMCETAPQPFEYKVVGPPALAFDTATSAPTPSLLMLLRYCGEHPRRIVFAEDLRLAATERTPRAIDALIRTWRHDERVQALVVETVSASRTAGQPTYPAQYTAAIRALTPRTPSRKRPPSRVRGVSR